jgi:putative FmdB family regulatory protein
MPIYEYSCSHCGVVEAFQAITENPLTRCPVCKKCKVKKLISESSFQLKGSGWYATDYAKKSSGNGNGKKHTEEKSSEKSADKPADKPATESAAPAKESSSAKDSSPKDSTSKDSTSTSAKSPA